ncbi:MULTISPECIES: hypothetical protein [Treponema]|uniref:Uncharacterized protein n=1 Tax=Treponema saccharophilum DSM 2985 TaxID=907348 RepID=H7EHJ8_9SPIR|nr:MULTISPECIES: hypothetical protein [Treponema]EIC02944.1 hypothetical protein TresaDRAFT_2597 [Treponema saccharophilum DSM 2985]BDC95472.1 hypothetical protein TRSA_05710 [Treponema saccharophilum]
MRLAKRFRPVKSSKLKRANEKKNAQRVAANLALLKAHAEADRK